MLTGTDASKNPIMVGTLSTRSMEPLLPPDDQEETYDSVMSDLDDIDLYAVEPRIPMHLGPTLALQVEDADVVGLVDPNGLINLISDEVMYTNKIPFDYRRGTVQIGTDRVYPISGISHRVRIMYGPSKIESKATTFYVIQGYDFDVLLGKPWLEHEKINTGHRDLYRTLSMRTTAVPMHKEISLIPSQPWKLSVEKEDFSHISTVIVKIRGQEVEALVDPHSWLCLISLEWAVKVNAQP